MKSLQSLMQEQLPEGGVVIPGALIREARKERKLTAQEVADMFIAMRLAHLAGLNVVPEDA